MKALAIIPKSVPEARQALKIMLRDLRKAKTYNEIHKIERVAEGLKALFKHVDDVRLEAGKVIVLAGHRIGRELTVQPPAKGGLPYQKATGNSVLPVATLAELAGYKMRAHRLKKLAGHEEDETEALINELIEQRVDNITIGAVLNAFSAIEREARRAKSRTAKPLPDGMELRIGDCRVMLADVPDNSVPLIITDPPYEASSEPLYEWLGEFARRVLIPGGSLICYTGHWSLNRDMRIFDQHLRYWWLLVMMHHQSRRLPGKFVIANFKPVLWYVKEFRRGRSLMPDILKPPARDKDLHNWGQGEGGVSQIIEHLTEPGELIVDPFAGTGNWGRLAANMGRRWVGADIVQGGTTEVEAKIVELKNVAAE